MYRYIHVYIYRYIWIDIYIYRYVYIYSQTAHVECVLLCFVNPIMENHYVPGVSSCQQTSDNNLGWPDPHAPPQLPRWLYWSPPLPVRTDPQLLQEGPRGFSVIRPSS